MTRLAMLIGSFLITFTLLLTGWMILSGRPLYADPAALPTPSLSPPAAPVETSAAPVETTAPMSSPPPSQTPTALPTPTPTSPPTSTPSPSPVPMRTPPTSLEPLPSGSPGLTQTFVVAGSDFTSSEVPSNGRLVRNGDVAVLQTSTDSSDVLWVIYKLDPSALPAGVVIHSVDALICGRGTGDFWEVYGPTGSEPTEYEVVPPSVDGCWHFEDAPTTDMSVIAATMLDSQLVVERVEFTIIFAR